jgi:D-isomer specific 2-hydroxyacid dehydrogenase, NAD binding domain
MSRPQSSPLEVTQSLLSCARAAHFDFGKDTVLVAVQHMLQQTVDLFRTIADMGLSMENIFALGKIYSNSSPVIETLREMGVTVVETTVPEPGEFHFYFRRDIDTLWRVTAEALSRREIKRILVLDDAGVCITRVPPEILQHYEVCGVEQTSSGMVLFEEQPPPFPVISWARTAVKLEIGGPIFSQLVIEKLSTELVGRPATEQLGIIGLGSIGRAVANLAAREGNQVLFYDPDPDLHVPHYLREKIIRLDTLQELMIRCDYVLGCSGRNPFNDKWPLEHRPGVKLVSASNGDHEFGPIIRDLKTKPNFKVAPGTWDITSEHGPSGAIEIAYLGYPYNFVSRCTEAVPTGIVQLETGGLLAALVQARLYLDLRETGHEQHSGMYRVSPEAQRYVYETWLRTMKAGNIDIAGRFGYDPATLSAAHDDRWFIEHTEPRPGEHYKPPRRLEEMIDQFVYAGFDLIQAGA